MSYELWDMDTGNLVEAFQDERSALVAARELIGLNAEAYPALLTLLAVDGSGAISTVASGDDLGALVAATSSHEQRRSR